MLEIVVGSTEFYDDDAGEFITRGGVSLQLEHSLVSMSKWESKYEKPFISSSEKTTDEVLDYVRMMVLAPELPEEVFERLSEANLDAVNDYINSKQSATFFNDALVRDRPGKKPEVVTAELVYYWMINATIPMECQYWHINRLFTLLRVFGAKNGKPTKTSRADAIAQRNALNAQRRAQMGSSG